jgi:radical SAM superfamily enzyme YgiQ (UPF0313 family)
VLLINPPITRAQRRGPLGPVFNNLYFNSPPLGIAYIAAVLERERVPVRILDAAVEDLTEEETLERIAAIAPDLLGITSTTNFFGNAVDLADRVKRRFPRMLTLLGGPHVSAEAEAAMRHPSFDYGCIGEGEMTTLELARTLADGGALDDIQGLVYRVNGQLVKNAPRPLIADLNILPEPARHLLPLMRYVPQPNDGPYLPKTAMVSSRGCPYRCIFCDHGIYGHTYRSFNPQRIVDEMEGLVRRYGIRDIAFVDSLFMINTKRVADITAEIVRRGVKVHWTCTVRANIATRDLLANMKAAGCWRVRIGIESANPDILRLIHKDVTPDQVRRAVNDAHELGLHPKGFFMIGHPTETRETLAAAIRFARALPLTDVTVQINTPMPGAPQWTMYRDYGILLTTQLEKFTFWEPVFVPHGMTAAELVTWHRRFYRSFYLRPIIVWRHLKMLRGWSDVRRFIRALAIIINMFIRKRSKE